MLVVVVEEEREDSFLVGGVDPDSDEEIEEESRDASAEGGAGKPDSISAAVGRAK